MERRLGVLDGRQKRLALEPVFPALDQLGDDEVLEDAVRERLHPSVEQDAAGIGLVESNGDRASEHGSSLAAIFARFTDTATDRFLRPVSGGRMRVSVLVGMAMLKKSLACAALVALVASAASSEAGGTWQRVRTANFTLEGDVSEQELRGVARRLEQFREVLRRQLPNARLTTPTPLTVVVFSSARDFKAIRPLFQGKPIEADGLFAMSSVGASISMCLAGGERVYPIIYHEYGHVLFANALPNLPLWLQEGLAEYMPDIRTLQRPPPGAGRKPALRRGGRSGAAAMAAAGRRPRRRRQFADLQRRTRPADLLRRVLGPRALPAPRRCRANSPVQGLLRIRIAAGAPADAAFAAAFPGGVRALESELGGYLKGKVFTAIETTFADEVRSGGASAVVRLSAAEVEAIYGSLLANQERFEEAERHFAAALSQDDSVAAAHSGLGLIRLQQGRAADALSLLRRGAALAPGNPMAQFALGYGSMRSNENTRGAGPGVVDAAQQAFARAVELLPEFPDALAYLGYMEMLAGVDLAGAERHVRAAVALLPGREDYRLSLAQVYMRQAEYGKAQNVLGPIAAWSPRAEAKAAARDLLGHLADAKNASLGRQATAVSDPGSAAGPLVPLYRELRSGERRIEGTLDSIQCLASGLVLTLGNASGSHRFWAPSFEKIQFITYRDDVKGTISCGRQAAAMNVYLAFRPPASGETLPAAGLEGVVVAVEYLPKEK